LAISRTTSRRSPAIGAAASELRTCNPRAAASSSRGRTSEFRCSVIAIKVVFGCRVDGERPLVALVREQQRSSTTGGAKAILSGGEQGGANPRPPQRRSRPLSVAEGLRRVRLASEDVAERPVAARRRKRLPDRMTNDVAERPVAAQRRKRLPDRMTNDVAERPVAARRRKGLPDRMANRVPHRAAVLERW
jgi:hypothetical protein